jgi:hypothetical protein
MKIGRGKLPNALRAKGVEKEEEEVVVFGDHFPVRY